MKRTLFFLCGLCWIAAGLAAGIFACLSLFATGGNLPAVMAFLMPVSLDGVFLGTVHFVGFGVLSAFCLLVGLGLCSGFFEAKKSIEGRRQNDE